MTYERSNAPVPYDAVAADTPPTACVAPGCHRVIMARGMCLMHYDRMRKFNSFEVPYNKRGQSTPSIRKSVANLRMGQRRWERLKERFPDHVWETRHDFISETGLNREKYTLAKVDEALPMGPSNWRYLTSGYDHSTPDGKKAYVRAWGRQNKHVHKHHALRRAFGITLDDYLALEKKQNALCAVCHRPETVMRKGQLKKLAVDHDHKTGRIRGLLCGACNSLIGFASEDIRTLKAAIRYLTHHHGANEPACKEENVPW